METEEKKETVTTKSWMDSIIESVKFIVLTLIIVIPFRMYVAEPYLVKGLSMDPTFKNNDYLIVEKISSNKKIERGNIIVFKSPFEKRNLIKRVVGLPGEKISLKNGKFTIKTKDGKEITLDETYVIFQNIYKETNITLKNDEYFVSGDNRAGSYDSRDWGPLKEKEIIGKPFIRLFRLNTIGFWPGNFDYEK